MTCAVECRSWHRASRSRCKRATRKSPKSCGLFGDRRIAGNDDAAIRRIATSNARPRTARASNTLPPVPNFGRACHPRCSARAPQPDRRRQVDSPATTILPSGWIATARARSCAKPPAMSVVTLPSLPKVVSTVPSALKRASTKSMKRPPTMTILPSGCSAMPDSSRRSSASVALPCVAERLVEAARRRLRLGSIVVEDRQRRVPPARRAPRTRADRSASAVSDLSVSATSSSLSGTSSTRGSSSPAPK